MRRTLRIAAGLTLAVVVLAACGDTDSNSGHDTHDDGSSAGSMGQDMGDGMGHEDNSLVADGARRIEVMSTSFTFDPDEITSEVGEDIAIVLTSDDIAHDFTIDELDAHVTADADETAEGGFTADEPGRYTYYCAVEGHREEGMEGILVVE